MIALSANTSRGVPSAISLEFHITISRSATSASSGMSCATHRTVSPRSPSRRISRLITPVVRWSWPVVGSSRMNTLGRIVKIDAMPTSLRSGKLIR